MERVDSKDVQDSLEHVIRSETSLFSVSRVNVLNTEDQN